MLYPIWSERQLIKRLDYTFLLPWLVGLEMDPPVWHRTTFTKYGDRLLAGRIAVALLAGVVHHAGAQPLFSKEHFTIRNMPLGTWASHKGFRPKDASSPGGR